MIDDLKVLARCISLWKSHPIGRPNEVYALDMVFQDAHDTVRNKNISKFQLLINEGSCYQISNFGVGDNGGKYPLLTHRYKMNFYKNTYVTRVGNFENNTRGFKFEPFANFTTKQYFESDVVDAEVIGTLVSMTICIPFDSFGVDKISRTLILEDAAGLKLECRFFDAWAKKFDNLYEQRESLGHVVMILQLTKVKYFNVAAFRQRDFIAFCMRKFTKFTEYMDGRISPGVRGDVHTLLLKSGSSSKFSSSDVVPFSIEETPQSKGVATFKGESSSSGSGKRTIINLDDYNEEEEQTKK
uniref:Replication protein A 70 kDa DNA-binding subunit B n=1 Tax=Tanacetum cinerariifolium TaxID=118510 RepID=A0A6L2J6E9_TANCI|nr:replication protein A 70 kDa DNA-binding subunit B [Tanacetum cinerariifolium]